MYALKRGNTATNKGLYLLQNENECVVRLGAFEQDVSRLLAKCLEVWNRPGVGGKDANPFAGIEAHQGFLRL